MSEPRLALLLGSCALPEPLAAAGWRSEVVSAEDLPDRLERETGRVVIISDPGGADAIGSLGPESAAEAAPAGGVAVQQMDAPSAPAAPDDAEETTGPLPGWQQGLSALCGTLERSRIAELPDVFRRLAPVRQVLESAGERRVVRVEDGTSYVACGFPDLARPGAKVLLVRETPGGPEIIALHRHPQRVGVCGLPEKDGYLPGSDWDPEPLAAERTGAALPVWGALVALEAGAVYTQRGSRVYRWDGRRETDAGTHSQALATLVLRWSQR